MVLLSIFGFTIGLQHFYAGNTRKGIIFLVLYWPFFVIGWILFVMLIGIVPLIICLALAVWAITDFIKLLQGKYLDGNNLPIVR